MAAESSQSSQPTHPTQPTHLTDEEAVRAILFCARAGGTDKFQNWNGTSVSFLKQAVEVLIRAGHWSHVIFDPIRDMCTAYIEYAKEVKPVYPQMPPEQLERTLIFLEEALDE